MWVIGMGATNHIITCEEREKHQHIGQKDNLEITGGGHKTSMLDTTFVKIKVRFGGKLDTELADVIHILKQLVNLISTWKLMTKHFVLHLYPELCMVEMRKIFSRARVNQAPKPKSNFQTLISLRLVPEAEKSSVKPERVASSNSVYLADEDKMVVYQHRRIR